MNPVSALLREYIYIYIYDYYRMDTDQVIAVLAVLFSAFKAVDLNPMAVNWGQ